MALTKCKECGEQISKKAEKCPKCGAPVKKGTSLFSWLIALIFGVWFFSYISTSDTIKSAGTSGPSPKELALQNTTLDFEWSTGGFGSIMEANFTITNNSDTDIKDIEITCVHSAKSGTQIDRNKRTIYDVVPAHGKKVFSKFNMGFIHSQAVKTGCTLTDLEI